MDSIAPQDLLDLKSRIDQWRNTRQFIRQAMPDDISLPGSHRAYQAGATLRTGFQDNRQTASRD
jgi:hypothetical protein